MKGLVIRISATLLLSGLLATTTLAQTSAQEIAAKLHVQLSEVQVRKAEMLARDEQLEEDLKPENIESSLAGIGSTRPELLREQRRRQLETVRARVHAALEELDRSRIRLDAAIADADAVAYWQSAGIDTGATQGTNDLP